MIRIPPDGRWVQLNISDKSGSVWYSKNLTFDEYGYIRLSPRTVRVMSDADDGDFGLPFAIGRTGEGTYQIATASDANWQATLDETNRTFDEDSGSNEPTLTHSSHAAWFAGLWHASTATAVLSRPPTGGSSQAWTSRITGLTSGYQHKLCVFQSRVSLCVTNKNVLKQYNSSYSPTTDLTIPADFEMVGLAYNNARMAVITRLVNDGTYGQNQEARFFLWDGATTAANLDASLGSDSGLYVIPYKSSFAVLTRAGELLHWNGGGFDRLAAFPFYFAKLKYGNSGSTNILGDTPMTVDGDLIHINIGISLDPIGLKGEENTINNPSGVWTYDPNVGLYHRLSPSVSPAYVNHVADSGVDTTTNVLTASAGVFGLETIPATGGIARMVTGSIGGLTLNKVYYIIKLTSTTFKLAETREKAVEGVAVDITSTGAAANYFWMYDTVDFGSSFYESAGAVASQVDQNGVWTELLIGARLALPTTLGTNDSLSMTVPFLENRGYYVSPKIFSSAVRDANQKLVVKFQSLADTDRILVKVRDRDVVGLPVIACGSDQAANWTGAREFYTSMDLSEAKEYLDGGGHLEIEFVAGAGGGSMVQIESISEDDGTYTIVLKEDVLGAAAGRKARYIIQNWKVIGTITSSHNTEGYRSIPVASRKKFLQIKVELRGYKVTIEELLLVNKVDKRE